MLDPVNTTASAVTILDRGFAAARSVYGWIRRRPQTTSSEAHFSFELRPIVFMIDLAQSLPSIELRYYAVNYLNRELFLRDALVSQLSLSSSPPIERIPLAQEWRLGPRSTSMIVFRRPLTDSEARVLHRETMNNPRTASFSLVVRAKERKRELTYGPVASMWIEGWINRASA